MSKTTTISPFNGFSSKAIEFLGNLKANNSKEWFNSNKSIYENEVKFPSQALVLEMASVFPHNNLPYISDIKKSLFRIYRDIRFSKNKDPYKTNLGIHFPYKTDSNLHKPTEEMGVYLHIEPESCFIACGIYMPLPDQLNSIRKRIFEDWDNYLNIINNNKFKKEFPDIMKTESLKRVPTGYPSDHPSEQWLKMKSFTFYSQVDVKLTQTRKIIDLIKVKCESAEYFHEFLFNAINED